MSNPQQSPVNRRPSTKNKNPNECPVRMCNFVKKLHYILTESNYGDTIRWTSNGLGFQIVNQEQFTSHILSRYYRHSNIPSFVRQLNMYGFRKIKNVQHHYYMHPLFIRDQPEFIPQISRKPEKKLLIQNTNDENRHSTRRDTKNSLKEKQPTQNKKQKKVRFQQSNPENKVLNSCQNIQIANRKQSQSSLANLINKSSTIIFNNSQFNDLLSICDNLEERQQRNQFFSIKTRKIFWTPSEILSEEEI